MIRRTSTEFIPSYKTASRTVSKYVNLKVINVNCCINNCVAYYGKFSTLSRCPICECSRDRSIIYSFVSPTSLLSKRFVSLNFCSLINNYKKDNGKLIEDVWNGDLIKQLKQEFVVINGEIMPFKHFEGQRESALGLSTDGIQIFKSRSSSCWPVVLIDYLIPPQLRMKKRFFESYYYHSW